MKRPRTSYTEVEYYKNKIEELTLEYQNKQPDVNYFFRLNAYRDAAKWALSKGI